MITARRRIASPLPHRRLGQVEVPGHLPDRAVAAAARLDDLGLELRCERTTAPGLLLCHGLHDGHPLRRCAPDGGCPSNRGRPTLADELVTLADLSVTQFPS